MVLTCVFLLYKEKKKWSVINGAYPVLFLFDQLKSEFIDMANSSMKLKNRHGGLQKDCNSVNMPIVLNVKCGTVQ